MSNPNLKTRIKRWFNSKRNQHKLGVSLRTVGVILLLAFLVSVSSSGRESRLTKYKILGWGRVTATAYNSMVWQCDDTPWITASGTRCREGVIAANFLPLGTKVMIEGFGNRVFIVEDRMNRRYTNRIDIWMRTYSGALKFGRRQIKYYIVEG